MKAVIETLVPSEWKGGNDRPAYYEFHLRTPHCPQAQPYKDIFGNTVWTCKHKQHKNGEVDGDANE